MTFLSPLQSRRNTSLVSAFVLISLSVLCARRVSAEDVPVACPGQSINSVLQSLDKTASHTLVITGACIESVVIEGFNNLALQGSGAPAVIERPAGWSSALQIRQSDSVQINALTIQGPGPDDGPPLVLVSRSTVSFNAGTIQGGNSDGLDVADFSNVNVGTSIFRNNKGAGISVTGHSNVSISAWGLPGPSLIQNNRSGLVVSDGATVTVGNVKVLDNSDSGVGAATSGTLTLGPWGGSDSPTLSGNGTSASGSAVSVDRGGVVWITPPTAIVNNPGQGVSVSYDGWVAVCCGDAPLPTISRNEGVGLSGWMGGQIFFWGGAVVEENRRGGLSLHSASRGHFSSPGIVIRRNGDSGDPNSYGGIRVEMNSVLYASEGAISDNYGPGVFVTSASSATFVGNIVITNNRGYGVLLETNSAGEFSGNVSLTGNKRFDLVCSAGAVAGARKGSHPAISKMNCPSWEQLTPRPAWEMQ